MEKIELRLILIFSALFALTAIIAISVSLIFLLAIAFTLYFFREPKRVIQNGIISPADGKIDYIDGKRVEIFMSPFDCHINLSPCDGVVERIEHSKGKFSPAFLRVLKNARKTIFIKNEDGLFKIELIAGFFARRIVCYVKEGENVKKGQRIGMIVFGSRVALEIPSKFEFVRKRGEKIKAGETIAVRI